MLYLIHNLANWKITACFKNSSTSEFGKIPEEGIGVVEGTAIDLIAAGGVIGNCLGVPKTLGDRPTKITCLGLLAYPDGRIVDLCDFYSPWETGLTSSAPLVLGCGTAAEIGKTTTAVQLIEGLKSYGFERIAACKLAGTGRKRDIGSLARAGAFPALDFPDVGLATTYTKPERYTPAIYTLFWSLFEYRGAFSPRLENRRENKLVDPDVTSGENTEGS